MSRHGTAPATALHNSQRAMLLAAGFGIAWVVLEAVVGARLQGHYHLMQVVWCRYAVHLATLVLLFAWRRPERLWQTNRPVYQLVRSLMMLVMPLSFTLSIGQGMPLSTLWSVFWLSPLLVVTIAHAALGERARWHVWAAAVIGALATVVMFAPARAPLPREWLLSGLMALSFSLYVAMTRSLRFEAVTANLVYTALGVFVTLTPFMPAIWVTPSPHDVGLMIGIGVIGLVALFALDRSASMAPVSTAAPILYLHVVGVAAVGLLLHGEYPTRRSLAGAAIIVAIAGFLWSQENSRSTARNGLRAVLSEDSAQ